ATAHSRRLLGPPARKLLAPAFSARQDIRPHATIAALCLVATQLLNAAFVPLLAHAGLALSIGVGATLNALLLATTLKRRGVYRPAPGWSTFIARALPAQLVLAGLLLAAGRHLDWVGLGAQPGLRIAWLAGLLITVVLAYFLTLFLCGFRPSDFTRRAR